MDGKSKTTPTNLTVREVAPVFLQAGEFDHDLGNIMPLQLMANATGIPLITISSLENHAGIFHVDSGGISVPIILSYNQCGLGHYDTVKPINLPASTTTPLHPV